MVIWFSVCLVCLTILSGALNVTFPAPYTPNNRLMSFILAYNFDHIDPFMLILNEYVSMCEGGWEPTLVVFSTSPWTDRMRRYVRYKTFCYRTNDSLKVRYELYDKSISISLASVHRKTLAEEINNYDMFVYHEDDIIFKFSHLAGYIAETKKLNEVLPENGLKEYLIGFQRYRRLLRVGDLHHVPYAESDIVEQELFEELPVFQHVCLNETAYLIAHKNTHQAIWALTRDQVLILQEKCRFFNQSTPSREHMSSLSLFDRGAYCGMVKLFPPTKLSTFGVNHYYQQRHPNWTPFFLGDENLRAGYHFATYPRSAPLPGLPACWEPILNENRADQAQDRSYPVHPWPSTNRRRRRSLRETRPVLTNDEDRF